MTFVEKHKVPDHKPLLPPHPSAPGSTARLQRLQGGDTHSEGLWIQRHVLVPPTCRREWSLRVWKVYISQDLLYHRDCICFALKSEGALPYQCLHYQADKARSIPLNERGAWWVRALTQSEEYPEQLLMFMNLSPFASPGVD